MNDQDNPSTPYKIFNNLLGQLTTRGEHFETQQQNIDGREYKVYKNAPQTLKELMDGGRIHGNKTFLLYEGEQLSFDQFFAKADMGAYQIHNAWGIKPKDKVAIAMRNYPEWMIAFAAIVRLGAVPVLINSWGSADEIRYVIEDSGTNALITDQARYDYFAEDKSINVPIAVARPDKKNKAPDWSEWILEAKDKTPIPYTCTTDDYAIMIYTSGTTGRPKGVYSTHRQVCQAMFNFECTGMAMGMSNGDIMAQVMKDGDDYAGLLSVPLFHVSGCYAIFLLNLRSGRRTIIMYKWDVAKAARYIEEERVGILSVSPAMMVQLFESKEFERAQTDHLFAIGAGGSAFPSGLADLIERKAANRLPGCGYGMTESNASAASMNGHLFRARPKAAGLASPIVNIKICDVQGKSLPAGEKGEIYLYGVSIASGYWQKPKDSAESFVEGWFRTGDIGYLDEQGYLFVVDRIKDMVIRAGENISSLEVERAIDNHPKVVEAAVFGIPHKQLGEALAAEVVLKTSGSLSVDDIKQHVSKQLAHFKVPEHVFLGTEPLPRNPAGKVLKKVLQKQRANH